MKSVGVGALVLTALGPLLKPLCEWVGAKIQHRMEQSWTRLKFRKHRRKYCSNLVRFLEDLQVLDMNLKLEDVYVPVKLEPENPPMVNEKDALHSRYVDLQDILGTTNRVLVLGDPGAGKTTLVRRLAIDIVEQRYLEDHVPIYVWLSDYISTEGDLWDLMETYGFDREYMPSLELCLEKGRGVFLFDGMDELFQSSKNASGNKGYHEVITLISHLVRRYPDCKFVVTSRHMFKEINLSGFSRYKLVDFGDRQIDRFVQKFLQDGGKVQGFRNELANKPQVRTLCSNPLFLTICTSVFKQRGGLPARVATLMNDFVEMFIYQWDASRNIQRSGLVSLVEYGDMEKRALLKHLAFYFHKNQLRYLRTSDLLEVIATFLPSQNIEPEQSRNVLGIISSHNGLVKLIGDRACFWHQTIQEYLCAAYCFEHIEEGFWGEQVFDPWWKQVAIFYSCFGDATQHIKRILAQKDEVCYSHITLAANCLAESTSVCPNLRAEIEDSLIGIMEKHRLRPVLEECQRALVKNFNLKVEKWVLKVLEDRKYQRQLRSMAAKTLLQARLYDPYVDRIISVVDSPKNHVELRGALLDVLASYGNPKAVQYVLEVFKGDYHDEQGKTLRAFAGHALATIDTYGIEPNLDAVMSVDSSVDEFTRILAVLVAGRFETDNNRRVLRNVIASSNDLVVQCYAVSALARIRHREDEVFFERVYSASNTPWETKWTIHEELSYDMAFPVTDRATDGLNNKELNPFQRWIYAWILLRERAESEAIVQVVTNRKEHEWLRRRIIYSLISCSDEAVLQELVKTLDNKKESIRIRVAIIHVLEALRYQKAIGTLKNIVNSNPKNIDIRLKIAAIRAIGHMGTEEHIDLLIRAYKRPKEHFRVKEAVIEAVYKSTNGDPRKYLPIFGKHNEAALTRDDSWRL